MDNLGIRENVGFLWSDMWSKISKKGGLTEWEDMARISGNAVTGAGRRVIWHMMQEKAKNLPFHIWAYI